MYSSRPNLMIGFHGCDESVRNQLVQKPNFVRKSRETFDWLGHGFYVWENNYERALRWAIDKKRRGKIENPSVVGVLYQLDHCLDFTDSASVEILRHYYPIMKESFELMGQELPVNKNLPKDLHQDLIIRDLDCTMIEYIHREIDISIKSDLTLNGYSCLQRFDTTRCAFIEGPPAFPDAGIRSKSHIQICIRNLNCIKGFFIPREKVEFPEADLPT